MGEGKGRERGAGRVPTTAVRCQLENDKVTSSRRNPLVMKMEIGIGSETDNCKWR